MSLIILLFIVITLILFYQLGNNSLRGSTVKSFLVAFFIIALSTEVLSLFNKITYLSLTLTWVISLFLVILFLLLNRHSFNKGIPEKDHDIDNNLKTNSRLFVAISVVIIAFISIITLFIALKAPPNNFDSMTYHMSRVSHWIQNQSVKYYPTSIPRQNYSMPLAEYAILHLQILSKTDHYANLIQWFCFILSIILSTQIAKELKFSARGQLITGVLTATLPMAILQSTSTQNDLVVGVFCLSFAYFMLRTIKDLKWEDILFASLSMGFALATKGTAYIYCASIGLSIGGMHLIGKCWTDIKKYSLRYLIIVLIALLVNTGIYARNWNLYGNPIFTSNERTISEKVSPVILFSNLVRNGAVHLATPLPKSNQFITNSITRMLGQELSNPASTFDDSVFQISFYISDDDSGNMLHFLTLTLSLLIIPWIKNDRSKEVIFYLLAVFASILFFSLAFKWQPWGGRLQTPVFLLGTVLIGYLIDKISSRQIFPLSVLTLFFLASMPFLLLNTIRPMLPLFEDDTVFYDTEIKNNLYTRVNNYINRYPVLDKRVSSFMSIFYEGRSVLLTRRRELYFLGNFDDYYWYVEARNVVRDYGPQEIGLLMDSNDWEYPIWVLLERHASQGFPKINHIRVDDISARLAVDQNQLPEIIMATNDEYHEMIDFYNYELVYSSNSIQVLKLQK